jgi:predicted NUDIX family phosphoesterase
MMEVRFRATNFHETRPAMVKKVDERVLVVPGAELDRLGRFQGFSPDAERYLAALLVPGLMQYRPRSEVEDDPGFKQIIPYVVFRCDDAVFCYTRGNSQGEARLHRLRSLGVGGHVAEEDAEGRKSLEAYEYAMRRELDEEVEVRSPGRLSRVGLINDDSTPVGRVHLGVVHLFELERPRVSPREVGLADAEFQPVSSVVSLRVEFETWSQICIDSVLRAG